MSADSTQSQKKFLSMIEAPDSILTFDFNMVHSPTAGFRSSFDPRQSAIIRGKGGL